MATIDDLANKSILDMSDEELLERLYGIRSSRRIKKKVTKTKKAAPKKEKSATDIMSMLSPDQAADLLKQLESK